MKNWMSTISSFEALQANRFQSFHFQFTVVLLDNQNKLKLVGEPKTAIRQNTIYLSNNIQLQICTAVYSNALKTLKLTHFQI